MKEISIFDVIGPNMIGPSSSHTAGALRIALMAKKIAKEELKHVKFQLYGSFAKTYRGHGTDRALVAGMLGFESDDKRIKKAFDYAKEAGLTYEFELMEDHPEYHPNTVTLNIETINENTSTIRGESIGGGNIIIKHINGVDIDLTGEHHTILVKQKDTPGVVAHITNCLAQFNVNIAFMKLYREEKGCIAYTIIEMDDPIEDNVIASMNENKAIASAVYIPK